MKASIYFISTILFICIFSACTKEKGKSPTPIPIPTPISPPTPYRMLTSNQLIDTIVGTYTGDRYCRSGSYVAGWRYDTSINTKIFLSKRDSNTLEIDGNIFQYDGYNGYYYYFNTLASGGGNHARLDSNLKTLTFEFFNGGQGGGFGCDGSAILK